jgi:hypothetical protein
VKHTIRLSDEDRGLFMGIAMSLGRLANAAEAVTEIEVVTETDAPEPQDLVDQLREIGARDLPLAAQVVRDMVQEQLDKWRAGESAYLDALSGPAEEDVVDGHDEGPVACAVPADWTFTELGVTQRPWWPREASASSPVAAGYWQEPEPEADSELISFSSLPTDEKLRLMVEFAQAFQGDELRDASSDLTPVAAAVWFLRDKYPEPAEPEDLESFDNRPNLLSDDSSFAAAMARVGWNPVNPEATQEVVDRESRPLDVHPGSLGRMQGQPRPSGAAARGLTRGEGCWEGDCPCRGRA